MGRTVRHILISAGLAVLLVGFATPANAALTLQAAWNMTSAPKMVDSTGGNDGTAYDVAVVSGAYAFKGTSTSFATAPDAGNLDPGTANVQVTARINFSQGLPAGDTYDIVRKGLSTTAGGYYKIEIKGTSTGAIASCRFKGSTTWGQANGTVNLAGKGWVTIVCTKTATQIKLSAAGQTVTAARAVGAISNDAGVTIGGKGDGTDAFPGKMDFVKISIG